MPRAGIEPATRGFSVLCSTVFPTGELIRPTGTGISVEEVAAVLGHTNVRTTRLHYDGTKVPPMVKVPIKLFHPEDPVEPTSSGLRLVAG